MKIDIAPSTGRPEPQFTVIAESQIEKLILKTFIDIRHDSKKTLQFHLHGHSRSQDNSGIVSFNFGWIEKSEPNDQVDNSAKKIAKNAKKIAQNAKKIAPNAIDNDHEQPVTFSPIIPESNTKPNRDLRHDHGTGTCLNPECEKQFTRKRQDQKCCSTKCSNRYHSIKASNERKQKAAEDPQQAPDDPDPAPAPMYFDDPANDPLPSDEPSATDQQQPEPQVKDKAETPPWYRKHFNMVTGFIDI